MLIRSAELRDARAIAEVHVASWQAAYRGIFPDTLLDSLSIERREQNWKGILADSTQWVLVCESGGRIVGFSSFGKSRDPEADPGQVAELYAIYSLLEVWDRGCGRALWLETRQRVRDELHAMAITVWVLTDNARGRRFYEKAGFFADGASKDITLYGVTRPETRYRHPLA